MAAERIVGVQRLQLAMRQIPADQERDLAGELDASAQLLMRRMRFKARKFRSLLANSIHVASPAPLVREIGPSADYAVPQEEGVRPGGKGLPAFSDPDAADIKAWLQTQAFRGQRPAKRDSLAAVRRNLELRDRYEALAWHIRHRGVKASPYVKPSFDELSPTIEVRLQAAAERALRGSAGSAA